jgi:DNA polymerase III delta prime subunit
MSNILQKIKILSVRKIGIKNVYDLSVKDTHNFYVGKTQTLTSNCDSLSHNTGTGSSAQSILRNILEEYANYSRFIFTCNYPHKIIEAIDSRVTSLNFHVDYNSYMKRCATIMKTENIKIDSTQVDNFKKVIRESYPDFRKALNMLQLCSITGKFIYYDDCSNIKNIANKCYETLVNKSSIFEMRKYLITNEGDFNRDYHELLKCLFDLIYSGDLHIDKKKMSMLMIAEGMHNHAIVLDKEINFMATMLKLDGVI